MWISKKKIKKIEKKIADLDMQFQSQQKKLDAFCKYLEENQKMLSKAGPH